MKSAYRTKSDKLVLKKRMPFVKEVKTDKDVILPKGTEVEIIKTEQSKTHRDLILIYFKANDKEYYTSRGRFEDSLNKHFTKDELQMKLANELIIIARLLEGKRNNKTFKCPECGSKVLEQTGYCVKCKKKVKKARRRLSKRNFIKR